MPCYHPRTVYRSSELTVKGKRQLVFDESKAFYGSQPFQIACGQCIGCRLEKSRQWAIRISNEASLYSSNCFVTLTYSPENLPQFGSLQSAQWFSKFLKRVRKKYGNQIRFFMCGEYGEENGRPHYHVCFLNHDFPDKKLWRQTSRGDLIYRSASLEALWSDPLIKKPYGNCEIGDVTFESAAYVARYITKKINGPAALRHYNVIDDETGEILSEKLPEYCNMSRNPGIGMPWLEKYHTDVFPHDYIVIRGGVKVPVPRYFNNKYEVMCPEKYSKVQIKRELSSPSFFLEHDEYLRKMLDNTQERLNVKEIVQIATINAALRRKL